MKKKLLALFLAAIMILSLAACNSKPSVDDDKTLQQTNSDTLFTEPTTISLMVASHASWPYNEDWPMWQLFEKYTGADFEVQSVPSTDMSTKVTLLMATPKDLPDMMFSISAKGLANSFGPDGAFISVSDNLDKMPNYKAFWESLPDGERNDNMMIRVSGDGKIYAPPNYGIQTVGNTRTWMYREDIFKKHGLTPPETLDEMYETAKKLKALYPDSYPICMRGGYTNMNLMGPQFKKWFSLDPYYNHDDNSWHFGMVEPEAKEMVEYFRKLVAEELIPPNYLSIPALSWEELVNTDRGFMMLEYLLRLDHFNIPAREKNPDYTWAAMKPPKANTPAGQHMINNQSYELAGFLICNTKDEKRIDNSIKLLDWLYSPKGIEFQSWGEEGVTYEVVDGEKKWLVDEYGSPYGDLGMGTPGLYQCVDTKANEALYSKEQCESGDFARQYISDRINPFNVLAFAADLSTERDDLYLPLRSYSDEMLTKFVLGQEPMENWDKFVEELYNMGVDRLLEIYTEQYNRIAGKGNIW